MLSRGESSYLHYMHTQKDISYKELKQEIVKVGKV